VDPLKSWFITTLCGLIHVIKANILRNLATRFKLAVCNILRSLDMDNNTPWRAMGVLTIARKPVPHEGADEYLQEITISRDRPSIAFCRIRRTVIMESVNKSCVHQGFWPDH